MTALSIVLGLLGLWVAKQVVASLIGQQARGSIPDLTNAMARRAARGLPPELADDYEEDWLAELGELEHKPLSAIRFARGLAKAARKIRSEAGMTPSPSYATLSRVLELTAGVAGLGFLAPALLAISFAIKLDARGPVFFRKPRIGRDGVPFSLLAFRTIRIDGTPEDWGKSDLCEEASSPPKPPARTRIGKFLERRSLAELPVFYNLARGEVALIGPPPQRLEATEEALTVRPGIFSWEALVQMDGCGIELTEAKRRDRARSFRSDLRLLVSVVRFELSGRRPGSG